MKTIFCDKQITGILSVLPETESFFDDEVNNYDFPAKQTMRLKKVMGYNKHRISKQESTASDFCVYGLNYLLEKEFLKKEEIGAIVVVTLSPDYFLPHISNIVHGECGLSEDILCMDIPQGCCGFLMGLMQSFLLLEHMKDKKIVLFNADVLSHKVSPKDRNDYPLVGDVTTVCIIENKSKAGDVYFLLDMDGKKRNVLRIPAGGFAQPSTPETAILRDTGDGNKRALDHLHMDGTEVFNFVQLEVPKMLNELFANANLRKDEIDYFIFHQPNKFMLKKLSDKLDIPSDKMFMNIVEEYGNPSGSSIPLNLVYNLGKQLIDNEYRCCLSAFGSGLAWGGIIMNVGKLEFCHEITSDL